MHKKALKKIIRKFLAGKATQQEVDFLKRYYASFEQEQNVLDHFGADQKAQLATRMRNNIDLHAGNNNASKTFNKTLIRPLYGRRIAVAAVLLIAFASTLLVYKHYSLTEARRLTDPIYPGHDGALLTLENGSQILLDTLGLGNISRQGNIEITSKKGFISYAHLPSEHGVAAGINKLQTMKGRRFKVVLPDGTQVWLNSASSLRYPTAFTGRQREVELEGEAYFEVTHNPSRPFIVHTLKTDIYVLGTGFNVMAYDDENAQRTTLVHGSVQVVSKADKKQQVIIKPGQEAVIRQHSSLLNIHKADTSENLAWMNDKFIFDNRSLFYIMRQIARWYDVSVEYEGALDNIRFEGVLSKKEKIQDILDAVEATQEVHFKIEGRVVTVIAGSK